MTRTQTPTRCTWGFGVGVVAAVAMLVLFRIHLVGHDDNSSDVRWVPATTPRHAAALLAELPDVDLSPEVAYDRIADFGPPWHDVDHNGCDTRNDVLRRDLTAITTRPGTDGCVVLAGRLDDPYTGTVIDFTKSDPERVQIDHLVPLHAAWQLGAWRWSSTQRLRFANDPTELVAADGDANQAKGDALADRWRPPNDAADCPYAIDTIVVHHRYGLGATRSEHAALASMLKTCQ